jgi:transposase
MEGTTMFLRKKTSGTRTYLQIVQNRWEGGGTRQRVIATLGRLDQLQESGELEGLIHSAARFCEALLVVEAHDRGEAPVVTTRRIGPALIFERLWRELGCGEVLASLLEDRSFGFSVERATFLTVLHHLFHTGAEKRSDRAGHKWQQDYEVAEVEELQLHHLYRAMAWLGEELPEEEQAGRTPYAARTTKDRVEERLFARRRDLFTSLDLVFFDTTSLYFEGEGGETLGQYGKSKDHRPDRKQVVVGAVLDSEGHPVCSEVWPGNASDVKSLVPIVDRLRVRFHIGQICVVADQGMFSAKALREVQERGWLYIFGARMRAVKEIRDKVVARAGRYRVVRTASGRSKDASPLKVKEVWVDDRRYVVCLNEDQKRKDAADRVAIVEALERQLKKGDKSLVGNRGYRQYLRTEGKRFTLDGEAVEREARYDGKWVLRTNADLDAAEVALKYKQLWAVEDLFRSAKSLLETRPIFHKCDATIRGHIFCSFLALVLRKELQDRLEEAGHHLEWADVVRDLDALTETEIQHQGKRFILRSAARGTCGKVFQAAGVALPPTVRRLDPEQDDP